MIEDTLSNSRVMIQDMSQGLEEINDLEPAITWDAVLILRQKFVSVIKGYCDLSLFLNASGVASRKLIKRVSDILWNTVRKDKMKEKNHFSNLYSYLTDSKLDCFGLALGVLAGCQVLGFGDVHLAMSEDHVWVLHGLDGEQSTEVTWHEKLSRDRRGEDISNESKASCWIYAGGNPVVCDRKMEVAAIVTALCPVVNCSVSSYEVMLFQQKLLWLLYDNGCLETYPMGLGKLGDLQRIFPGSGRPSCSQLYSKAIRVTQTRYSNRHVYPYLYAAGHYHSIGETRRALEFWVQASQVLKHYRHQKEDEELYKEFLEINNEYIPNLLKNQGLLLEPSVYRDLVLFYDGLCCWEEHSSTPVLHIGWVKHIVKCITSFNFSVRAEVEVFDDAEGLEQMDDVAEEDTKAGKSRAILCSAKMMGLKKILKSERINSSTLQLQLTAPSQVDVKRNIEGEASAGRTKRLKNI